MKTTMSALAALALVAATDVRARRSSWRQCERERDNAAKILAAFIVDDQDTVLTIPDQK